MFGPYRYAHCTVASQLALPELQILPAGPDPDFVIEVYESSVIPAAGTVDWQHDFTDNGGAHAFRCFRVGDAYGFDFPCVAQAWVTADNRIALFCGYESSIESLRHVLLDQILPRVLAQRGHLVLHAAAVRTADGHTLLLLGDSGMGKSTLAAAFAQSGAEVLSDDGVLLVLESDAVHAVSCYPGLRLWPDSLDNVIADRVAESTPMTHYNQKRRLCQPRLAQARYDVDAIVILHAARNDSTIVCQASGPQAACMALIRNTFQLDLGDHANVSRLLPRAAEATRRVPVLTLAYPRDYALLPRVIARLAGAVAECRRDAFEAMA
jgi:hypothetical protein